MNKALEQTEQAREETARKIDWRRRISDHVAYGLLIYTGLHIFLTLTQLKSGNGSMLPYLALVVLVAAIIPACRWFEMRWSDLPDVKAHDPALAPAFRREVALMWLAVFGLPVLLTLGFKAGSTLF
ncbi:hypothetical protein GCM10023208_02870 [Erythrobacter westpacificensis]|uniref:Uncharacterized protein n=1 Tax=Erythrobacter westpacificensis TaxID=1055231 RepID=A0ABP9JXJ5_9SPHN